jgi:hypothetical protein
MITTHLKQRGLNRRYLALLTKTEKGKQLDQ